MTPLVATPGPALRRFTHGRSGYTVIELLMSLTVLALSASGIIAMQRITLESNRYAKNLAIATRVGEAWAEQLEADSALWSTLSPIANTNWLKQAGACTGNTAPTNWIQPDWVSDRHFGAAFDALGGPVDTTTGPPDSYIQFCTHLRFAWLNCDPPATGGVMKGNGVIRTEIRVFWRRDDDEASTSVKYKTTGKSNICEDSSVADVGTDIDQGAYNVVYFSTAIREVPQ